MNRREFLAGAASLALWFQNIIVPDGTYDTETFSVTQNNIEYSCANSMRMIYLNKS